MKQRFPIAKVLVAVVVAIVAVAAVATLVGADDDEAPLTVDVYGEQYLWGFGFPDEGNSFSKELHVPLGQEVRFDMRSEDVVHAFWVPEWEINKQTIPGITTTATVTPEKAGTYQVICSDGCGIEHNAMRAKLVVEPPEEFQKWVEGLDKKVPPYLARLVPQNEELEAVRQEPSSGS